MSELPDDEQTPVLRMPLGGVPAIVDSQAGLQSAVELLLATTGPIAIDAERASGHRYGQRAFLVQLRRGGAGTFLFDPVALDDLGPLAAALSTGEWILHSATQDLPCLAELGLRPTAIFDTELAARLLGLPRVGLAGLSEDVLGVGLAKGHGAADWSRRPLPDDWLIYAALDVELLTELRDDLSERLRRSGRTEWARQEFAWLLDWQPRARQDPWRRTSGISRVTTPRGLAVVRELWQERESLAESLDRPPTRVLRDEALIAAARTLPQTRDRLASLPEFQRQRRDLGHWWSAVTAAGAVPEAELPPKALTDGPPPPRSWERRRPGAAARLKAVRAALTQRAKELQIAPEVLISPEPVRTLVWDTPDDESVTLTEVEEHLRRAGCRDWQVDEVAEQICQAIARPASPAE